MTNDPSPEFWRALEKLVEENSLVIDRPRGAPHPRRPDVIYPLDYGYLAGTTAGDGQGIDVWLGRDAERRVTAIACTADVWKRDAEIKILLACGDGEIEMIDAFLNQTIGLPCLIIKRNESRQGKRRRTMRRHRT
ncbi:inorganic pyrophosphatase [Candidatus Amarolinea aalborgensis]|uniref:inorganic pyrophosphatase n=1 Tax=Candidatus Amarolinea aalborgensis TaxID=2249329 RepID=UPI003BF99FDA